MKKILVPIDFSRASISAVKVAAHLARQRNDIKVRLSHVYHVPRIASLPSEDYGFDVRKQHELVDIRKKLNALAKEDFVRGLKIETQVIPHIDVLDLIRKKDNKNADLIICGVHNNPDWRNSMEGSHADVIIRNADCPVLCVNEEIRDPMRFDNVVFASDFRPEMEEIFPDMKKVLDLLGGRLHLVKVITPHHFEKTLSVEHKIKEFARKYFLTNYTVKALNEDTVEQGIHMYAYYLKADLIAMETHAHSGFMHVLKASITESVAHHSELAVLSMKIPQTTSWF